MDRSRNQEREEFRKNIEAQMHEMGIETRECSKCGEPLIFLKTHSGKWQPVDMYFESHFANCPHAVDFKSK